MLFNSFEFLLFFPLVFALYWFVFSRHLKLQNSFLLIASYLFYGWWDWRFVFLLMLSTLIDYSFGLLIDRTVERKKLYLWLSIINNLAILGFFKYYNFFAESAAEVLRHFGFEPNIFLLSIILPVGISFYTFHGMSYVIDIYHGKAKPITDFVSYAVFVCFFPLLVAGPIERAHHLLPQVLKPRTFDLRQATDGVRLIIWGFFKKVVIADNLSFYVNAAFDNPNSSSLELIIGVVFFAFQIYCDFSGYSDIALGTAKLLGFELLINFRTPYFSRDIAEFWRRWHISLTTWFRDYLYIPLGGSKAGRGAAIRNTFIVFIVSGFWHGANWTFIVWGALNALYFVPLLLFNKNRVNLDTVAEHRSLPTIREFFQMVLTFALICSTWIFFRAATVSDAFHYVHSIFTHRFFPAAGYFNIDFLTIVVILVAFILAEWTTRVKGVSGVFDGFRSKPVKYGLYYFFLLSIFLFGTFKEAQFIYFQF